MLMNVSLEKPTSKGGWIHAGALTADFEALPKDHYPPRGAWQFEAPANLGIQPGWRLRLKAGKPWYVSTIVGAGEQGIVKITLVGQP